MFSPLLLSFKPLHNSTLVLGGQLLRGTRVNRTYGTHKKIICFPIFANDIVPPPGSGVMAGAGMGSWAGPRGGRTGRVHVDIE